MKPSLVKLAVYLTVISFTIGTKYWYCSVVDAPDDTLYFGFPIIFMGNGWHTSMSLQIFTAELIADVLLYLLFWLLLVWSMDKFIVSVNLYPKLLVSLLCIAGVMAVRTTIRFAMSENVFLAKRNYDIKILRTGHLFIWQPLPNNGDSSLLR